MREQEVHRQERHREPERIESRGSRERIPDGGGRRIELREEIPPREVNMMAKENAKETEIEKDQDISVESVN